MQGSLRYLLYKRRYSQFCLKFCYHGNNGRSWQNSASSISWPISENSRTDAKKSRRFILHKPRYKQFCPKFRCHGEEVSREKCNWQHSMAHPRKPFIDAKIWQKSSWALEQGEQREQLLFQLMARESRP